jgi:HPr kinase/phosphorylase
MIKKIQVAQLVRNFSLEVLAAADELTRTIGVPRVYRPGLEFVGFFEFFPMQYVQVLGRKEIYYLNTLAAAERSLRIANIVKYHPPCFIVTAGQEVPQEVLLHCRAEKIPLLRTGMATSELVDKINSYLSKMLAPEVAVHGVCINVSGIGVLLRGKSGVGKSEIALTLIRRGHRLVADDIVVLKKVSPYTLLGTHNGNTAEMLALRSIGLINVTRLYGRQAYQHETRIVLDIELTRWQEDALNNALELTPKVTGYLGVEVPHIEIQLEPGRDVAGLIEAAANNWYLQQQGYSATEDFYKRLDQTQGHMEVAADEAVSLEEDC